MGRRDWNDFEAELPLNSVDPDLIERLIGDPDDAR